MTTDSTPADDPDDTTFDVPEMSQLDDGSLRRAVRRGVLLTALVSAAWLLLAGVILYAGGLVSTAVETEHFHNLTYYGAQVGRPGYEVSGNSCCSSNLGLTNAQELDLRRRGALEGTGQITGRVSRGLTGGLRTALPDDTSTPVGAALGRGRPAKAGTSAFLESLPPVVSASAIVEFGTPLDEAGLDRILYGGSRSLSSGYGVALVLTDPYAGPVVSWPEHDLARFATWVGTLTADDNDDLDELGAPSLADLRTAAQHPGIRAVVVERATVEDLRAFLENPQVRSVNIAEVGFDPARQVPDN